MPKRTLACVLFALAVAGCGGEPSYKERADLSDKQWDELVAYVCEKVPDSADGRERYGSTIGELAGASPAAGRTIVREVQTEEC